MATEGNKKDNLIRELGDLNLLPEDERKALLEFMERVSAMNVDQSEEDAEEKGERTGSAIEKHIKEATENAVLSENEKAAMESALQEIVDQTILCTHSEDYLCQSLTDFWQAKTAPSETIANLENESRRERYKKAQADGIRFSRGVPDWTFAMSAAFVKAVKGIDKKTQGRILDAISKLCEAPVEVVGDTVKPLTGNMLGLWRYRIGDYRLIYQPEMMKKLVILMSFDGRGSAYEQ